MNTLEKAEEFGKFGHWELYIKSGELTWSNQVYAIFQLDPTQFKPNYETFLSVIHPEDRDLVNAAYTKSLKNKKPYTIEHRLLFQDNSVGYVSEQCETFYDEDGNPVKSIGTVQDVTEKVLANKRLIESESKFKAISNQTTEGITVADTEGNYVFVNPAFCNMSGYSEEELLKMTVFDMKAENQDQSSFKTSKEKMEGLPMRVNLRKKNGEEYLTEIIGDIITIDNDKLVLGTIRDITETVKAEEEIIKLNENLEAIVKERTEKLEESLKVKEILLKEITHRVKNNLQIITSLINLQKSTISDQNTIDSLSQVSHRIQSMALIHETLYKSNEYQNVDFDQYLDSLLFYVDKTFSSPNIKIKTYIENSILPLDTATNCGMIIMELITNSVKYAFPNDSKGEIHIQLKQNNNLFTLVVSDTGIGFPEHIDYKVTHTLGMQVVVSLAEQINGNIALTRDKGTKFEISFPSSSN